MYDRFRIARAGKPHTIAEDLLKPCMTEVVTCVLGEDSAKKVARVQCSNNIVSDRIHKISDHIEFELIGRLNESNALAIQLDESPDDVLAKTKSHYHRLVNKPQ